jgi:molybdopterin-synthase adenylyltransferase
LFAQEEAYSGACTARSTIYCANITAGLMVGKVAKWLRGLPFERRVTLNLLARELTVASWPSRFQPAGVVRKDGLGAAVR